MSFQIYQTGRRARFDQSVGMNREILRGYWMVFSGDIEVV
jgi:hypothetical protein